MHQILGGGGIRGDRNIHSGGPHHHFSNSELTKQQNSVESAQLYYSKGIYTPL